MNTRYCHTKSFNLMSGPIKVSVDGDSGVVVARNPEIHIVNPNLRLQG